MKKPSSGLGVGLWVVGGLVALYLLGAAVIIADNDAFLHWYLAHPESLSRKLAWTVYGDLFAWMYRGG